ncbi:cyclin-I [Boleophthalmus pectinirostris]|uniref:cyclin-I n=1 Tax=Boleophthalmus pectinirostris TaxID=150288 RepID=UPI000A1C363F|nr:cyclin-I [Boleophthalmus pectinirostris]
MKFPGPVENRRLLTLLEAALHREARLWKVPVYKNGLIQGTDTSSAQHQEVIRWVGEMSRCFRFCPETFALGVCILHRMLSTVKAQPKYLKCMAFTSLILAAKINEEDEVIGCVKDLVVLSGCSFSTAEILRMERIILDKLHWDLYTATPVDFIHIFHALLVSGQPFLIPSIGLGSGVAHQNRPSGLQGALWTRQVQHCMACHQLWQFKGSTLALAIITLELEALTPDWFSICNDLMKKAQVDSGELIHCRETVDEYLHSLEFSLSTNAVYILDTAQIGETERPGARRGRGQRDQGEHDDYYDGFGCLYSEEMMPDSSNGVSMKNVSPCPPLHPPVI